MKSNIRLLVALVLGLLVLSVSLACRDGGQENPVPVTDAPATDTQEESAPTVSPTASTPPFATGVAATPVPSPVATPAPPAEPTLGPTAAPVEEPTLTAPEQGSPQTGVSSTAAGEPFLAGNVVEIVTGAGHSCGLRDDGTAVCWGRDSEGQASPPAGSFESLSAHRLHTCGAMADGGIQCWGQSPVRGNEVLYQEEQFVSVSSGSDHLCGLRQDGGVLCWTDERGSSQGLDQAPDGEFRSIDVGYGHTCGTKAEGGVVCWGSDYGEAMKILTQDMFASVSTLALDYSCGLRSDGTVDCWGLVGGELVWQHAPVGRFTSISLGASNACGVRNSGEVACWDSLGSEDVGFSVLPGGSYTSLSMGDTHACALRAEGPVVCWGEGEGALPPGGIGIDERGEVYSVSAWRDADALTYTAAARNHTCQWRSGPDWPISYSKFCWGRADVAAPEPEGPTYVAISALSSHVCAVQLDGEALCWGWGDTYSSGDGMVPNFFGPEPTNPGVPDFKSRPEDPPSEVFSDVAVGRYHTCGLRMDGSVICWGGSHNRQATSPGGEFTEISAGEQHTCGLRPGGQAVCWGEIDYRGVNSEPPAGDFQTIRSGNNSICGLLNSGWVECWGDGITAPRGEFIAYDPGWNNACGVTKDGLAVCQDIFFGTHYAAPRLGALSDVSTGSHNCGLRPDGTLICWDGRVETITPPGGTFSQVSVGNGYTCALRTNGAIACWGNDENSNPANIPPGTWTGETLWQMRQRGGTRVPIPSPTPAAATPLVPLDASVYLSPRGIEGEILPICKELCSDDFWYADGTVESVKALLKGGSDLTALGVRGETALHWAVGESDAPEVPTPLLENGTDPSARTSVLMTADTPEVATLLLENGADPSARTYDGTSVLMTAVYAENGPAVIDELFKYGAILDTDKNDQGETVLSAAVRIAAFSGNSDVVRFLLENGADATVKYTDEELTILHMYLIGLFDGVHNKAGNPEIVKLLLDYGSDPIAAPTGFLFDFPVLSFALLFVPDLETVRAIVEHAGSEQLQEPWGSLALYLAVNREDPDIVELLLNHGADPNGKVDEGDTPLHSAIPVNSYQPPDTRVIQLLLENGADVNAKNDSGNTPLHKAMQLPYVDIVQLLLEWGADVSALNDDGNTPLHEAVRQGREDATEAVELLLGKGASVAAVNRDGETPLHIAVVFGFPESVALLLTHGADPNATAPHLRTPLHTAALLGSNPATFGELISAGADVDARDEAGDTPLHLLLAGERWYTLPEENLSSIITLLLEAGAASTATNADGEAPCDLTEAGDEVARRLLCR